MVLLLLQKKFDPNVGKCSSSSRTGPKGKAHTVIFVTVAFSKIIKFVHTYIGNFNLVPK